jgi:hypothetical protein
VTRDLESLHRELPVHETPKRSGPLDPNHRGSLDLVQELVYRSSGNGVTSGLGRCISNSRLPKPRNPKFRSPEIFEDGRTVADF